jgi:hypothetical protein
MSNPAPGRVTSKKNDKSDPKNSFVLSEEVGILNYNFEPYGGSGVIPEPSSVQIASFKRAIGAMIEEAVPDEKDEAPKEKGITPHAVKRLAEMLSRDSSEQEQKLLHVLAEMCSDSPSFDTLDALPYRAQQSFFGWISGTFLFPEGLTPVTMS